MSMGFLLPPSASRANSDTAQVWRGLMVQKAAQQLLFEVDWRGREGISGLDALVVDMPPGTGDVQLTLGQLVKVDGTLHGPNTQALEQLPTIFVCRCYYRLNTTGRRACRCSEGCFDVSQSVCARESLVLSVPHEHDDEAVARAP